MPYKPAQTVDLLVDFDLIANTTTPYSRMYDFISDFHL